MIALILVYFRLIIARAGLRRIIRTIQDERAVQAWRRGDATALASRQIDLSVHRSERRATATNLLAFTAFLFAMVSGGMHWSPILTRELVVLAVGLFILSVAQTPLPGETGSITPRVGRNAPCPCGSGKKYKHCHGASHPSAA
jgi:uncharacterized protein YecA (UPF0149 family)